MGKSNIDRLRIIGFLEGISFLILIGVGMPLKYIWNIDVATVGIGYAHGILFILYVLLVFPAQREYKWSLKITFLVLVASLLPFGTFVAEKNLFRKCKIIKV